ncbi:MAG: thioesterase [Oscillospiraceae bacterium]|nr:thioesterase [Oscillospiraceae bacterium]
MSTSFELNYRVDSRDMDMFSQCRPSAVLGIMQEAATQAAAALKVSGPEVLEKYGAIWIVNRNWVELDCPLRWDDQLLIRTWHRGPAGVSSYRDFDVYRDGKCIGQAVSSWVMVEAASRKFVRLKDIAEYQNTDGGELKKAVKLRALSMPGEFDGHARRDMRYSDTDINGHINNIHYADFACDALHLERLGAGKFVRSFQIDYLSECMAGESITLDTAVRGNELFAQGVSEDGVKRFDCAFTLADL